jgi:hypothetical protein
MAGLIELDFNPDQDTLRKFGYIALGGFGLLAAAAYTETLIFSFGLGAARIPVAGCLLGLGVLSALLSLVAPKANRAIYVGLSVVAFPIGFVISHVVLALIFLLLISPIALVFRIARRNELRLGSDPSAASYWSPVRPRRPSESYFSQF